MNKKDILKKTVVIPYGEKMPLFKGFYIIQERKLHDSGYRILNIIGHTEYDKKLKDFKYYFVSLCSDVVDIVPIFHDYIQNNYNMCDIHLDINKNGLIHIWTNSNKFFNVTSPYCSSCRFEILEGTNEN